jgi:uroporphyrinogen-III synthase
MMAATPVVILTGAAGSLAGLEALLQQHGLGVEEMPLMAFAPPEDWQPLNAALRRLGRYEAIALTSPRAADAVIRRAQALGIDLDNAPPIWSGPASAPVLQRYFSEVRTPGSSTAGPASLAVSIANAMLAAGVGSPVLFPCGETHREELPVRLRASGRRVEPVICYRCVPAGAGVASAAIERADVIVATSPTVATSLANARKDASRTTLVCIGPTTAEAAASAGWAPDAIAERPTAAAVARAIQSLTLSCS